ncbi:oxidoreductase [Aureococcus anophagefferens]|nr:oxidoreductase [Aureococcus anophagefferens]
MFAVLFVEGGIWVLWLLLNCIDLVLVALSKILPKSPPPGKNLPRVVVVGASFAGLGVVHELGHHRDEVDVTLVDRKDFFEYVPGALRPASTVRLKGGKGLDYDLLVLCSGSSYVAPIRGVETTLDERRRNLEAAAATLKAAKTVVIMGAGAVGVELAGEILTVYPQGKRVLLVDMATTILPGFHARSVGYCKRWLEARGAELLLGAPLRHVAEKSITLHDGTEVPCDALYKCTGARPNGDFLAGSALGDACAGPRGAVVVDDSLRGLDKLENTDGFAMGARRRPGQEEKGGVQTRPRAKGKKVARRGRTRPPGVIAEYFPFLVFPYFFTYLAAAVEIVGSFCLAVGIFARPASLLLAGTMMNALAFHLMKFGPQRFPLNPESRGAYTYEPCLAFLGVTLYFAFAGPGKFAMRPHGF